ncbi:MAG: hypothetical protein ACRDHZ_23085 [Ktedonobacteraceae bacterium]
MDPPTILKDSKSYPFNKLAGLAYELLVKRCDVLRVVGSSLRQNDWNILSLIFNAQRHREVNRLPVFQIELIMPPAAGKEIKSDCGYLKNITPIEFLSEGDFSEYRESSSIPPESDLANPLYYWLNEKRSYHQKRGELPGTLTPEPSVQPTTVQS